MHTHNAYTFICTHVQTHIYHVHIHAHIHTYTHKHTHTCLLQGPGLVTQQVEPLPMKTQQDWEEVGCPMELLGGYSTGVTM